MKQFFNKLNCFMDELNKSLKKARNLVQSLTLLLLDVATVVGIIIYFF